MASQVILPNDRTVQDQSQGTSHPLPNHNGSSESDMFIIATPTESNEDISFTHLPALSRGSAENLQMKPAFKLIQILAAQNKQLRDTLVANNTAWKRQLEAVARQKQQYETALKGSGDRACAVVTSLMQTWSPLQTHGPSSGNNEGALPGGAAACGQDTLTLEVENLRAQCFHLEQEKKALLQINQELERAGGSPSLENGFCLVDQLNNREEEPQTSTPEVSSVECRLRSELEESVASARALEAQLQEQTAEINSLRSKVQESIAQINQLETENRNSEVKVQKYQEQVQGLQQQVQSLLAELNEKNAQVLALSKKYQELQMGSDHTLSELDMKILQRDDRIRSLEALLVNKDREYKQQSQKLRTDLQQNQAELSKCITELATRQGALTELRKDHHEMLVKNQNAKDALMAENLAFKQERMKFQAHLSSLKKDLDVQLKAKQELEENVQLFRMQAECFQADFEAERKAREDLHSEKLQLQERLEQYELMEREKVAAGQEEAGLHSLTERMRRHAPERYRPPPRQQQPTHWQAPAPAPQAAAQQPWTQVTRNRRNGAPNDNVEPVPLDPPLDRQATVQELICPMCGAESPDDDSFQLHLNDCIK